MYSTVKSRQHNGASPRAGTVLMEFVLAFPIVLTLMLAIIQFAHIMIARQVVHYAAFSAARVALVTMCSPAGPNRNLESAPTGAELSYRGFHAEFTQGRSIASGIRIGRAQSEAEFFASEAAARICSSITLSESLDEYGARISADGGAADAFDAARRKTRAIVDFDPDTWSVVATVEHDFALVVPIVGQMLGWGVTLWDNPRRQREAYVEVQLDDTVNAQGEVDRAGGGVRYPHMRLTGTVRMPKPYRTVIAAGDWRGHHGP